MSTFREIKGFHGYEADTVNGAVRNAKSGKLMSIKKGTGKYYLPDNRGKKKLIALVDMVFDEPLQKEESSGDLKKRPEVIEVLKEFKHKHRQNWELHKLGFNKEQIADITNSTVGNVTRDLWGYKNDKYKL